MKSSVPSIWFLVAREQKLGAMGHRALLEHGLERHNAIRQLFEESFSMEINFLVKGTQFGLEIYPGQQAEITHKMTFKFLAWSDVNLGMLIAWTFPPNLKFTLQK